MCSYNRINGTYAAENHWLLTEVLRDEWGFDGLVVSDWGAVNDRVASVRAGLDLTMPAPGTDYVLVDAWAPATLDEAVLDVAVDRVLDADRADERRARGGHDSRLRRAPSTSRKPLRSSPPCC